MQQRSFVVENEVLVMGLRAATQLLQQTLTAAFVLGKLQTNGHLQLVSSHNLTYRSRNKRLIFRRTAMTIYFKAKLYINKLSSFRILCRFLDFSSSS